MNAGDRLGSYEIIALIGKGGMGDVYRAHDSRLGRDVAVKVSAECFNDRFEQEARAIAQLNHPHICQLYDVGPNYLVMELVEGAPLKGPLPFDKVVEYAGQILDALDAAHKKGITHRDLKPANILVTKQGVKLLDFGLAKQTSPLKETDVTRALTGQGQILGTLQYMSPEQLQGKEVDARSDLFSFGCVLYEMLTGKRAFEGESPASVIAAILEREPAPLEVARPLDRVIRRSLAKDPDQRFQTARDLKAALSWALEQPAPVGDSQRKSMLPWAVAATLAIIAIVAAFGWWRATRPTEQMLKPLVRLDVDLGPDVSLASAYGADVIISPDGNRLVFVSNSQLFTRRLDQPKATELAGTEAAAGPFFSPDSQWVAFFAGGKLKKISVEGGTIIVLCDAPTARGGSWGDDGNIIAALTYDGPLSRIPSAGGAPTLVTELGQGEVTHRWPQILPGSKAVLFAAHNSRVGFDNAKIEVMSFQDHQLKTLHQGGTYARYVATSNGSGHLVYINKGTLSAVPFDLDKLEFRGTPAPVLEGAASSDVGFAQFDFSLTGTLVYRPGAGAALVRLEWLDGAGQTQPLPAKPGPYSQPHLSPDGKRLALTVTSGSASDIWTYDWQRDATTRLTFGEGGFSFPVWSPDGQYVIFHAEAGGMFWTRGDGANKPQPLTQSKTQQFPFSFSPDGKWLAFAQGNLGSGLDIMTAIVDNEGGQLRTGKPEVFLQTPSNELYPSFSPDGRWIAYRSFESGPSEIYVRAFPDNGGKWLISNSGGFSAAWSRNGRELFYRTEDQRIMVVTYTTKDGSFVPDKPRVWSETRLADMGFGRNFDIAPDGKRFLVLLPAGGSEDIKPNHVTFLLNFFDELRRRAPVNK